MYSQKCVCACLFRYMPFCCHCAAVAIVLFSLKFRPIHLLKRARAHARLFPSKTLVHVVICCFHFFLRAILSLVCGFAPSSVCVYTRYAWAIFFATFSVYFYFLSLHFSPLFRRAMAKRNKESRQTNEAEKNATTTNDNGSRVEKRSQRKMT